MLLNNQADAILQDISKVISLPLYSLVNYDLGHELNVLLNSQAVALLQTIVRLIGPDYYLNPGSNQQGGGGGLSNGQYTRSQLEIYSIFEVRKVS